MGMARDGGGGEVLFDGVDLSAQQTLHFHTIGFVVYALGEGDASGQSREPRQQVRMVSEAVRLCHSIPPPILGPEVERDTQQLLYHGEALLAIELASAVLGRCAYT